MTRQYNCLSLRQDDRLAIVTFDRPEQFNAFNPEMEEEFHQVLDRLEQDDEVSVVVLTGAGKAFCAGQDLQTLRAEGADLRKNLQHLKRPRLLVFEKPVIAAVNGVAIGAGADITLMSDMVIASEKARFSFPGAKMGFVCPYALIRLKDEVGRAAAKELMMTGRMFNAAEALALRLINKVVPPGELMDEALALGRKIADAAPLAVRAIKESVNRDLNGCEYSYETMIDLMGTADSAEGIEAFLQKRKPGFMGR